MDFTANAIEYLTLICETNMNYTSQQLSEMLSQWHQLQSQLSVVKVHELRLRNLLFGELFPNPVEGTNKFSLTDGYVLKAKHVINRTVDEAVYKKSREEFTEKEVPLDIVKYKIELSVSIYKGLDDEQTELFDRCLVSKPGTPSLELVVPKVKD